MWEAQKLSDPDPEHLRITKWAFFSHTILDPLRLKMIKIIKCRLVLHQNLRQETRQNKVETSFFFLKKILCEFWIWVRFYLLSDLFFH